MDAQGGRPARNFYLRIVTLAISLVLLVSIPFAFGAWYAPFHSVQEIIPENLKLKRQNKEIQRNLADANTLNELKEEQLDSLKEQLASQEKKALDLTKELNMFKSILDVRKGKGIQLIKNQAEWVAANSLEWQSLFVKGGSYPRYLKGSYNLFALDTEGNRLGLNDKAFTYRFESHTIVKERFEWKEAWRPTQVELVIYNSRRREVLKQTIQIQGK